MRRDGMISIHIVRRLWKDMIYSRDKERLLRLLLWEYSRRK
ncbi:MAG: hypothetical protein ACLUTA_17655 [Blautia wexlerae]